MTRRGALEGRTSEEYEYTVASHGCQFVGFIFATLMAAQEAATLWADLLFANAFIFSTSPLTRSLRWQIASAPAELRQ